MMRQIVSLFLLCIAAVFSRNAAAAAPDNAPPPIIFVHGNGDDAARWVPTIWLFESNGYPADRLFAIRFTNPVARTDDTIDEPFRSSTTDAAAELSAFVTRVLIQTHSHQVVLIGSSRGGLTIRNYLQHGGGQHNVTAAILCGTPNHGVISTTTNLNGEFNGGGHFLTELNQPGPDRLEVVSGVRMMTLRSDRLDKYAQPTGITSGKPEIATGVNYAGPELKGATNIVMAGADHRELAFARGAFAHMFHFLTGREPQTLEPTKEQQTSLSGIVTGFAGLAPTNQPLAAVHVHIYEIVAGATTLPTQAVYDTTTTPTGAWGPFTASSDQEYVFDLELQGRHVRYFLAPIPRSTSLLNLRFAPVPKDEKVITSQPAQVFLVARPEGYLSRERDPVKIQNEVAAEEPAGLPVRDSFFVYTTKTSGLIEVKLRSETILITPSEDLSRDLNIADFLW